MTLLQLFTTEFAFNALQSCICYLKMRVLMHAQEAVFNLTRNMETSWFIQAQFTVELAMFDSVFLKFWKTMSNVML